MDEQSDLFSQLFVKCLECDGNISEVDLEILIDNILKLDYGRRIFAITTTIAGEVLCHFASNTRIILSNNEFLLNKYFQLVVHLTSSQEIILESTSVNTLLGKLQLVWERCSNNAVSFQLLLEAVAAVTYQNGAFISQENLSRLLQAGEHSLPSVVKNNSLNMNIRRTGLQTLAGLCLVCDNGEGLSDENMEICLKLFIFVLQDLTINPPHDVSICRLVFATSKGLHNILSTSSNIHLSNIGPLLAVLKKFMVYGLPGLSDSAPTELQPVPIPELNSAKLHQDDTKHDHTPQATPTKSHTKKKKRKPKSKLKEASTPTELVPGMERMNMDQGQMSGIRGQMRPSWIKVTSSESEYSDTEGAQKAKLRSFLSKIRQMCLSVLYLTVKKTDKHTMLGYWSSFLPESTTLLGHSTTSLFTSFRQDSAPKCRAAALGVVGAMLEGSRWYLGFAAEETGSPSQNQTPSFVPFSLSLATSLREIHRQLLSASSREQSTMALSQLLKTLSTLVANTPYKKMKPGLLIKVSSQARYFLSTTRDLNVKVASLALLGAVTSTSAPLAEVASILSDFTSLHTSASHSGNHTPIEYQSIPENSMVTSTQSWMVEQALMLSKRGKATTQGASRFPDADQSEIPQQVRVEALQTLTKICKGYLPVIKHYIGSLGDTICQCLEDSVPSVRMNAGKLLEELGSSLLQLSKSSSTEEILEESISLWNKVLCGSLQKVMQDHTSPALQGKACDSLSNIGPTVFQRLPKNLQIMCLTLLLGFTSDENAVVRSPAVRALGVYVMFPSLREDIAFLEDVISSVLRLLDDPFLVVRANAAWSLGNLTDTIVINQEIRPHFRNEFQDSVLMEIFEKALQAVNDKVKVLFNMMRVLGNLLRSTDSHHVSDSRFKSLMLKSTKVLADMVVKDVMVKVRWNACIACSNFFLNEKLPLGDTEWTDHVYEALCNSVATCKNFKVRIKAVLALTTPTKREHYGAKFGEVFGCLIRGFEDSNAAANFTEFKFKDTLQEQLCTALIHMTILMQSEDLRIVCEKLAGKTDEVNQHLMSYYTKLTLKIENERVKPGSGDSHNNSADTSLSDSQNGSSIQNQSSMTNDPVEEYIVAKQLSSQEKLRNITSARDYIRNLTSVEVDPNDNILPSNVVTNKKLVFDRSLLTKVFTFEEV